ncbi:Maf-like protein [Vibrio sp. S4M6]|uniref:Maf family protein n=1 Tax=Vibrio sinus TaxID=2946865 RepID=UPI00202A354C|nr:nucleoside triphosphate pyrophosphatase [Vibrio sinus]MCL9783691.1 Maf-like protein [Vibrio sinus]
MAALPLVLASTSPYRQTILNKLAISFSTAAPQCDETPLKNESPVDLVRRLSIEKAKSCHITSPSLIIGSDQVCVIDNQIVGKPLTRENAIKQLEMQSGKAITFYTGVAVYNSETQHLEHAIDTVVVHFRSLTTNMIERYVDIEQPYYCAGSFKCEGLGIALFEKIESKDPNTLVGLPLIDLVRLLENQGLAVL